MSKESEAKALFGTLCNALDDMQWTYNKDEENLVLETAATGDSFTIRLRVRINADRQVMYLKSPLPFNVKEDTRELLTKAICYANYQILNGSFEYDQSDGYVAFKVVVPFMNSLIGKAVCNYMIIMSCKMMDTFAEPLLLLTNKEIDYDEFCKRIDKIFNGTTQETTESAQQEETTDLPQE